MNREPSGGAGHWERILPPSQQVARRLAFLTSRDPTMLLPQVVQPPARPGFLPTECETVATTEQPRRPWRPEQSQKEKGIISHKRDLPCGLAELPEAVAPSPRPLLAEQPWSVHLLNP